MLNFLHYSFLTGASIIACRKLNRYIVALEADEAIFKAILYPMIRATNIVSLETIPIAPLLDDDEEPMFPSKKKRIRTCT
jgi:hypothetical protein